MFGLDKRDLRVDCLETDDACDGQSHESFVLDLFVSFAALSFAALSFAALSFSLNTGFAFAGFAPLSILNFDENGPYSNSSSSVFVFGFTSSVFAFAFTSSVFAFAFTIQSPILFLRVPFGHRFCFSWFTLVMIAYI